MLGDIVFIQSDKNKRALWRIGEVIEIIKGADGVFQAILLKTSLKNKFYFETLGRPIERLCLKPGAEIQDKQHWIKERRRP